MTADRRDPPPRSGKPGGWWNNPPTPPEGAPRPLMMHRRQPPVRPSGEPKGPEVTATPEATVEMLLDLMPKHGVINFKSTDSGVDLEFEKSRDVMHFRDGIFALLKDVDRDDVDREIAIPAAIAKTFTLSVSKDQLAAIESLHHSKGPEAIQEVLSQALGRGRDS